MMSDVESAYIERDQDYSQVGCLHLRPRVQLHVLLPWGPLTVRDLTSHVVVLPYQALGTWSLHIMHLCMYLMVQGCFHH